METNTEKIWICKKKYTMQKFLVIFQPFGINKFLSQVVVAENLIDAAIIFERENNGNEIFQITKII